MTKTDYIEPSDNMRQVRSLLKQVPEDRRPIAEGIYSELVFMQNTLNTLKQQVQEQGAVDLFQQGKQKFLREHPALKAYNTTIQRYSLLYKQLIDLLPKDPAESKADEFIDFIRGD